MPALLVAKEPDLGTAILLVATGAAVMMLAGLSLRVIVAGVAAVLAAAALRQAACSSPTSGTG